MSVTVTVKINDVAGPLALDDDALCVSSAAAPGGVDPWPVHNGRDPEFQVDGR